MLASNPANSSNHSFGGVGTLKRIYFCGKSLVNAPPTGDRHPFAAAEIERCEERAFGLLERCGLTVRRTARR